MSASNAQRPVMGGIDVLTGVALLLGIWVGLPARWMPVDVGGSLLGMGFAAAGVGLLTGQAWAPKVAQAVAGISVGIGMVVVTLLAMTAGELSGLYGPVGMGGAAILAVAAALLLPYLVVFPASQLYFLAKDDAKPKAGTTDEASEGGARGAKASERDDDSDPDTSDDSDADASDGDSDANDSDAHPDVDDAAKTTNKKPKKRKKKK